MAIEFPCPACGQTLRVAEEYAGKTAKCPECQASMTVPAAGGKQWFVQTARGERKGPVAKAELDRWVSEGKLTSEDQVLQEGSEQWQWAAEVYPNLVGGAATVSSNPYATPNQYVTPTQPSGPLPPIQHTLISGEQVISDSWEIYKEQFGMTLAGFVIVFVLNNLANAPADIIRMVVPEMNPNGGEILLMGVAWLFFTVLGMAINVWLMVGQFRYFLQIARGQTPQITDLFTGWPQFPKAFGLFLLLMLMVLAGTMLCIVPGVILALMFMPSLYLLVDRDMGVMESLNRSQELTNGNKGSLFLIGLFGIALAIGGLLACCIGILFTMPLASMTWTVAYLGMTGELNIAAKRRLGQSQ